LAVGQIRKNHENVKPFDGLPDGRKSTGDDTIETRSGLATLEKCRTALLQKTAGERIEVKPGTIEARATHEPLHVCRGRAASGRLDDPASGSAAALLVEGVNAQGI